MKILTELNNSETLRKVKTAHVKLVDGLLFDSSLIEEGLELLFSLEKKLKIETIRDKKMLNEYKYILISLRVRLFSYLREQKVYNFFKSHFVTACTYDAVDDVSFSGNIRHFFGRYDFQERDAVLQKILQNVRQNTELIGTRKIVIEETEFAPQFRNWVREYTQVVGAGRKVLENIRDYMRVSENAKRLQREERAILFRCLKYYELLKVPVSEVGSLGAKTLIEMGFDDAEISGIDEDLFNVYEPERLLSRYESYLDFKRGVRKESPRSVASPQKSTNKQVATPPQKPIAPKVAPSQSPKKEVGAQMSTAEQLRKAVKPLPQKSLNRNTSSPQSSQVTGSFAASRKNTTPKKKGLLSSPESLSGLTIDTFRSLGKTDAERMQKVSDAIADLKKSNSSLLPYWQRSPLYRLYLSIGRESMTSDKTVAEIGERLKGEEKTFLTEKEFENVAEISAQF